jgi:hypothetical protein
VSVPLLGQQGELPPPEPIELYDHEILAITEIVNLLAHKHQKERRNYVHLEAEITDRFNEAGFLVYVNWYFWMLDGQTQEGCLPEITVIGRTARKHEFDHDRQVSEVTKNILDIPGADGVIKTDKDTLKNFLGGQGGHGHGHSHS